MYKSIWITAVLFLFFVWGAVYADGSAAWIELGSINIEHGLSLRNGADGQNEAVMVGEHECRRNKLDSEPPSYYFYFDYDAQDERLVRPVYVTVEYFDSGFGRFSLEYDSADTSAPGHGTYKSAGVELLLDSKKWRRAVFELDDARFEGRQNLEADFRIVCLRELDVRMVSVEMGTSSNLNWMMETWTQRAEKNPAALSAPRGLQVIFEGSEPESYQKAYQAVEELRLTAPMFRVLGATSVRIVISSNLVEYDSGKYDWAWCSSAMRVLEQNGLKCSPYFKTTEESFLRQFADRYAAGVMIGTIFVDGEIKGGETTEIERKIANVRKVFRSTPLYVCLKDVGESGGSASSIMRAAAKYDAGIFVESYGSSYAIQAAVGLARAYGCPVVLGVSADLEKGSAAESVFKSVVFGVKGVYVKQPEALTSSKVLESWRSGYRWLGTYASPPRTAVFISEQSEIGFGERLWAIRDAFDYDLVDAYLIRSGVLARYKNLVIASGLVLDRDVIDIVKSWVKGGGKLILFESGSFKDLEGVWADFEEMFDTGSEGVKSYGAGKTVFVRGGIEGLGAEGEKFGSTGFDISIDGVYVLSLPRKGFLVFNSNREEVDKEFRVGRKIRHVKLPPDGITIVD